MKGIDLLEKYPLAGNMIKGWFMKSMLESFKDETVPDEFKEFMLEQGIEDDKIGTLIDINPRMLLDVFDENEIFICINHHPTNGFSHDHLSFYKTRKESELIAIIEAFEWLEKKLTPIEFPKLEE